MSLFFRSKVGEARNFVYVYRVISLKIPLSAFDINHNYNHGNVLFDWKGDFVTHNPNWTWFYGGGMGKDLIAEYLIPASLLEMDMTTHKQEPYYVISKSKLEAAGIKNVGVFLNRMARVEAFKSQDRSWEPDYRFDDDGPAWISQPPKNLHDPKIKWMSRDEVESMVQRGE